MYDLFGPRSQRSVSRINVELRRELTYIRFLRDHITQHGTLTPTGLLRSRRVVVTSPVTSNSHQRSSLDNKSSNDLLSHKPLVDGEQPNKHHELKNMDTIFYCDIFLRLFGQSIRIVKCTKRQ